MQCVDYKIENKIGIITLNRPESLNALNARLTFKLQEVMHDFRDNDNVWVGILTGAGSRAFSAGADIKESISLAGTQVPTRQVSDHLRFDLIWKPVIAAINGYCLGGGLELALTCDLRLASENARFGTPEVQIGTLPAGGAIDRLPRFIGRGKAAELMLLGQQIDAQEALKIGLINKVVPPDKLMTSALEWANLMRHAAPLTIRAVKEGMLKGYDMTLEEGLINEGRLLTFIRSTQDFKEGAQAFKDKRKPDWSAK